MNQKQRLALAILIPITILFIALLIANSYIIKKMGTRKLK